MISKTQIKKRAYYQTYKGGIFYIVKIVKYINNYTEKRDKKYDRIYIKILKNDDGEGYCKLREFIELQHYLIRLSVLKKCKRISKLKAQLLVKGGVVL